ncbi:calcium calmodulin-dependent protein kinase 1 alpha [Lasius niger]|uniref:Calcium calmodulin-dependent protein kinase 1 alpha n=1 Tax=Lasius niger TaxID=67767 RepID=A0A0J7KHM8_LASNI|nr:calcium calmodulin-dependent protein kinase 1 alpha [Lasius niger]
MQWLLISKDIQLSKECPGDKNETATTVPVQQQSSSSQIMLSKSSSPSPRPLSVSLKPTSAPRCFSANLENINTKRPGISIGDDDLFVKREKGSSNKSDFMEEAVAAIKQLSNDPTVQMDAHDHFGAYVAARLRAMDEEQWRKIELEIIKIFASIR